MNREARTVEVAFSSETPIEDFPGVSHVLEHGEGADLSRLNDSAPVLVNHDHNSHVGVVERAWIGDDRKGRALLRFGNSALANEVFDDVVEGIRRHISVGANITGDVERIEDGDEVTFLVRNWQAAEISIASIPADTEVGIGRTQKPQAEKVTVEDNKPDKAAIERGVTERLNELYAIGREYNCLDMAQEYATNGKTSDDDIISFKRSAVDKYIADKETELERLEQGDQKPVSAIGLSDSETKRFSVTRALNAMLENNWKGAEFERECSMEVATAIDREPNGFFVPFEVQTRRYERPSIRREMTTGGAGTGAEHVGTFHDGANFIEQLRTNIAAVQAGARMLPGLRQNLDIPKKTSGATFAWLAESGTVTLSDLGTGQVQLSPKTVGGGTQASRRMLKQSIPAIDDLIMQDLVEGAAEIIDLGAIEGSGASNQPTGVINTTGINTQVVNPAGQPTYAEVVGFRTAIATDNALRGRMGWITTSAVSGFCMTAEKSSGSGRFIMEPTPGSMFGGAPDNLIGYPVYESNQLTAGTMILGNWAELLIGMWGVLDLRPDPYTAANADALIIRAFQDIDIGVRHAESFCHNVLV